MDALQSLLRTDCTWTWVPSIAAFKTTVARYRAATLTLQDFPDEPLWRLDFNGASVEFDDEPECWQIEYDRA